MKENGSGRNGAAAELTFGGRTVFNDALATALFDIAVGAWSRPAIRVKGRRATYGELFTDAGRIARGLRSHGVDPGDRVAILAHRTYAAYCGILGALMAGCAYVPLNTRFPLERNALILKSADCRALILDDRCAAQADRLVGPLDPALVVATPEGEPPAHWSNAGFGAAYLGALPADPDPALATRRGDDLAYVLFTSGTTGAPKGVAINQANVAAYLAAQFDYAPIHADDRVLQSVDLTFDISVLDMFTAWIAGAELVVAPENSSLLTPRIIAEHQVTATCLVPSTATRTQAAGLLRAGSMPSLRMCIFGGEAVPVASLRAWQEAAPNAAIWSLYGPTELTIAVTYTRYRREEEPDQPFMPLGNVHRGTKLALLDLETDAPTREGPGEIVVTGPQTSPGYWRNPAADAEKFLMMDGARWYRTGDVGRWSERLGFLYAGRSDRQVKVRGFRVELLEVEGALRRASGRELVAAIAWPLLAPGNADGVLGFIAGSPVDVDAVLAAFRTMAPDYMTPSRLVVVDELPVNDNGKTDYAALERLAREAAHEHD